MLWKWNLILTEQKNLMIKLLSLNETNKSSKCFIKLNKNNDNNDNRKILILSKKRLYL